MIQYGSVSGNITFTPSNPSALPLPNAPPTSSDGSHNLLGVINLGLSKSVLHLSFVEGGGKEEEDDDWCLLLVTTASSNPSMRQGSTSSSRGVSCGVSSNVLVYVVERVGTNAATHTLIKSLPFAEQVNVSKGIRISSPSREGVSSVNYISYFNIVVGGGTGITIFTGGVTLEGGWRWVEFGEEDYSQQPPLPPPVLNPVKGGGPLFVLPPPPGFGRVSTPPQFPSPQTTTNDDDNDETETIPLKNHASPFRLFKDSAGASLSGGTVLVEVVSSSFSPPPGVFGGVGYNIISCQKSGEIRVVRIIPIFEGDTLRYKIDTVFSEAINQRGRPTDLVVTGAPVGRVVVSSWSGEVTEFVIPAAPAGVCVRGWELEGRKDKRERGCYLSVVGKSIVVGGKSSGEDERVGDLEFYQGNEKWLVTTPNWLAGGDCQGLATSLTHLVMVDKGDRVVCVEWKHLEGMLEEEAPQGEEEEGGEEEKKTMEGWKKSWNGVVDF